MLSAIVWTPKGTLLRHNAGFEPLCVKIHPRTGHFSGRVLEKN